MTTTEATYKKYVKIFWIIFGTGILGIIILFSLIANGETGLYAHPG